MKWAWLTIIVFASLMMGLAIAQTAPGPGPTPSVSDLDQQLQEVGCKAERNAAAQTIVQLRSQIETLQKKLDAKDPPSKSGATKH